MLPDEHTGKKKINSPCRTPLSPGLEDIRNHTNEIGLKEGKQNKAQQKVSVKTT